MADDPKHSKPTRTFERHELADLTAASKGDAVEELSDSLARGTDRNRAPTVPAVPAVGRTQTLSDPLTMALLAEVARSQQTIELEPDKLGEALAVLPDDEAEVEAAPHPHVKRR